MLSMRRTAAGEALTDLILEIFRVNGDLLASGDELTRDLGQTSSRWQVLGAIRSREDTVSGIARVMGLTRQSVQRTTDLLAEDGLVEYVDNPVHRRAKLVRLTDRGRAFLGDLAPRQAAWANGLAKAIKRDAAQIEQVKRLLADLRTELETRPVSMARSGDKRHQQSTGRGGR
jgi:DNA-binding MarR family transcriptional regulator